jgi:hypothetical protein
MPNTGPNTGPTTGPTTRVAPEKRRVDKEIVYRAEISIEHRLQ